MTSPRASIAPRRIDSRFKPLDRPVVACDELRQKPKAGPLLRFPHGRVPPILLTSQDTDMRLLAALLVVPVLGVALPPGDVLAQDSAQAQNPAPRKVIRKRSLAAACLKPAFAKANPNTCARIGAKKNGPVEAKQPEQPTRPDFTADDQAAAAIPGIPEARFWSDSQKDFLASLPTTPGPWLVLSTG